MSHFKVTPKLKDPKFAFSVMLTDWGTAIEEDTAVQEHASYIRCCALDCTYTYAELMEMRMEHILKRATVGYTTRKQDTALLNTIYQTLKPEVLNTLVNTGAFVIPSPFEGRYSIDED